MAKKQATPASKASAATPKVVAPTAKKAAADERPRSLPLDIFVRDEAYDAAKTDDERKALKAKGPSDSDRKFIKVLQSIDRYRSALRRTFCLLTMAELAGAEVVNDPKKGWYVKPQHERARYLLAWAFDTKVQRNMKPSVSRLLEGLIKELAKKSDDAVPGDFVAKLQTAIKEHNWSEDCSVLGGATDYELRAFIVDQLPKMKTFVWDGARRDCSSRWAAQDPDLTKATRGFLTLQGARALARFQHIGISFPLGTAKPQFDGKHITLNWDDEIGPVEFKVGSMDGGRWHWYKQLVAGDLTMGTCYLNYRKGKDNKKFLRLTMTYSVPVARRGLDPARTLHVRFDPSNVERCFVVSGPNGAHMARSAASALGRLSELRKKRKQLENRKEAAGSPRRPWGNRRAWKHDVDLGHRCAEQRTQYVTNWNHAWSRMVADRAVAWHCGTVSVLLPKQEMFGHPWNWSQLEAHIKYKVEGVGGTVVIEEEEVPAAAAAAGQ